MNVSDGATWFLSSACLECNKCNRVQLNHLTWCYMDVSNTALILTVRLQAVNQLLCPEWVSDTAPLSAQCVNENHVLSDNSLCAVGSRIMNKSQHEHESRPHSSLCESRQSHSRPACSRLSSTELWKERISSWSDSVHFVHSKDLFERTVRSRPKQYYWAIVHKT